MKNNRIKVLTIILLVVLAVGITGLMVVALLENKNGFSYFNLTKESKIILEKNYTETTLTKISIETNSADVKVVKTTTPEIKVLFYGDEQDDVKSEISENELTISHFPKNRFCFGFCGWKEEEIIIYLPENQNNNLEIKTISGDIEVQSFERLKSEIKTTSGDIHLEELEDVVINTTSGDVEIDSLKVAEVNTVSGEISIKNVTSSINLKTTSGDIELGYLNCEADSKIKSTSGDVTIKGLNNTYVETKTISGDIQMDKNERTAPNVLTIETTSGDIKIK